MKWSWKLGRVSGIKIQVHWTFLILIAWVVWEYASLGADVTQVIRGVILVLAVFSCVVLHELGHALTAKRFGVRTRDITLLPIGGVARLERMPEKPSEELLVAVAGPAVNVVIAILLFTSLAITGRLEPLNPQFFLTGAILIPLAWMNVLLVAFNLLPAFPMDGGRMLRAVLAMRLNYVRATQIAAGIGQGAAILFGLFALVNWNPVLFLIAIFVYLGAQAESQQVQLKVALEGIPVADAMITRFITLEGGDPLHRAIEELLAGSQQDFPVTETGRVIGMLMRKDLISGLKQLGRETPVAEVMRGECPTLREDEPLERALTHMRAQQCSALPVVRGGDLVGLLTLENVGELIMVNTALGGATTRGEIVEALATE